MELPTNLSISLEFNVIELVKYKAPLSKISQNNKEIPKDVNTKVLPPKVRQQAEKILESKVKK